MSLPAEILTTIQKTTAIIKWRKANYHVIYFQNVPPQNVMGNPVYVTGREIAGEDFNLAIGMIEALLRFFGVDPLPPTEAPLDYAALKVKPAALLPNEPFAPMINGAVLQNAMLFAAIMRFRKTIYHIRYQADNGQGKPIGEYVEHPAAFSSGIDSLLLASMLETLGAYLGGTVLPEQMLPDTIGYEFFGQTLKQLNDHPKPSLSDMIDSPFGATTAEIGTLAAKIQPELVLLSPQITKLLPVEAGKSTEEMIAIAKQIKPLLEKFLLLTEPLTEELG